MVALAKHPTFFLSPLHLNLMLLTDEQHVWSPVKAPMREGSRMVHRRGRSDAALYPGALCQRKVWREITVITTEKGEVGHRHPYLRMAVQLEVALLYSPWS